MSSSTTTLPAPVDLWLSVATPLLERIKTEGSPNGYYLNNTDLVADVQKFVSAVQCYRLLYPDIFSLASDVESFAELDRVVDEILFYTRIEQPIVNEYVCK